MALTGGIFHHVLVITKSVVVLLSIWNICQAHESASYMYTYLSAYALTTQFLVKSCITISVHDVIQLAHVQLSWIVHLTHCAKKNL